MDTKELVRTDHSLLRPFIAFCLAFSILIISSYARAESSYNQPQFINVGTGGLFGAYYPMGSALCRITNRTRAQNGIHCKAESTSGSTTNIIKISEGDVDLGLVANSTLKEAYDGSAGFAPAGPNHKLRTVLTLHEEPFTIVVRKDANISSFEDLKGKRVNIGNPGSSHRMIMDKLMEMRGWHSNDFALQSELSSEKQSKALCTNQIDAFVFAEGNPSASIMEAARSCNARIIGVGNIPGAQDFERMTIPKGLYPGQRAKLRTIGVTASLAASSDIPTEVVYRLTKGLIENFDDMKSMHPGFRQLSTATLLKSNSDVPLHGGARRYFVEVGLLD